MEIYTRQTYKQIFDEIFRDTLKERLGTFLAEDELRQREAKELIIGALLKTGKISIPYIMRKFKCNLHAAKALIKNATKHECLEWDRMEIDYFYPEFGCCHCFTSHATL